MLPLGATSGFMCRSASRSPKPPTVKWGNLMELHDHYPKYVVTLNEMDTGIENGIKIVHLADFLLAETW